MTKYNNLQENPEGVLPPADPSISQMEKDFENRDMNNQLYNMRADDTQFREHSQNEKKRIQDSMKPPQEEYYDEEDYDEYEIEEIPLWKKIINEIRVPLFIFLMILVFMSEMMNSSLLKKAPFLGNVYNENNTELLKQLSSILAYLLIKFIRV